MESFLRSHNQSKRGNDETRIEASRTGDARRAQSDGRQRDAAQAAGEFRIGTPLKTFKEAGVASKTFTATINAGHLLSEGLNVGCAGGTGSGTAVQGGTGTVSATFTGCSVAGAKKTCKVFSGLTKDKKVAALTGEGTIKGSGEKGELMLMEGKHYLLFFWFMLFDVWGKLCPLNTPTEPLHVEVFGSFIIWWPDWLSDLVNHEIQTLSLEVSKSLFPASKLFLGKNEAHFGEGTGPGGVVTGSVHLTSNENWGGGVNRQEPYQLGPSR